MNTTFFLKCTANHSLRNNLFNKIILNKPDFIEEIPLNKIKKLLDAHSELSYDQNVNNILKMLISVVNIIFLYLHNNTPMRVK
jgi:hypothetical protein